jgi:predicted secreted protein
MAMLTAKTKVMLGDLEVHGLDSIPAFSETKSTVEVTSLENEARVYIAGLKEPAESLEFTGFYDGAHYQQIREVAEAGDAVSVQITLPDGVVISFDGEVSVGLGELSVGEALKFTLAITPVTEIEFDFTGLQE